MPYIVYCKQKSNNRKVVGLFQDERLAGSYAIMRSKNETGHFLIEEVEFKDESPEIIEYVLSKK
ncbi:hypothetical protein EBT16_05505 [bacterium]|nr:hypothetical protein [bacterium]